MSPTPIFGTPSDGPTPQDTPLATPSGSPPHGATARKALPRAEDIHLILSDVDGTLFTNDHELHPKYVARAPFARVSTRQECPTDVPLSLAGPLRRSATFARRVRTSPSSLSRASSAFHAGASSPVCVVWRLG